MTIESIIEIKDHCKNIKPDNYQDFLSILAYRMDCKNIVELGVARLVTTNILAFACPNAIVIGIDIDNSYFTNANFPNIVMVNADSIEYASEFKGEIDLLFIDADHTYDNTMGNYLAWKQFVRNGGIICFDDTNCPSEFPELLRIPLELEGFIPLNELHHSGFGCIINKK